jgi:MFS family permease
MRANRRNREMNDAATADDAAPERLDWRLMLPVFLVVSLYAASAASTLPILPFYIQEMGGTPLILGIVMGTEALTHLVAAPLIGQLSDRLGRKRILLATQATAFVSLLLLGLAQAVIPVLLARMLFGFTGGTFAAAAAYAADHSSPANRRQAIGTLHAGVGLGGIVGAGISGYLSDISLTAPIYAAMVLSAVSFTVTALWLKRSPAASQTPDASREVSFRSIVGSPLIRVLVVVLLCYFFAYGMYSSQLANYLQASFVTPENPFGPRELGYVLAADGAINILVQLFLLRWLGRFFTVRRLIIFICAIVATGYMTVGLATTLPVLVLAILCVSFGDAMARPTFFSALSVHAPQERQGIVIGTTQSLIALTDVASPVFAGLLIGQALYGLWTGVIIALVALTAAIAWRHLPAVDPETAARAD